MSDRNQLAADLARISFEVLNKLAIIDDVPQIAGVNFNLMTITAQAGVEIQMMPRATPSDLAGWAELFEANVVIEQESNRFGITITCDAYQHPVRLWSGMDFATAVAFYAKAGLDANEKRHELTAQQLRELAAEAVQP
ncbi:hypothetical protein SAMN05216188_11881 [Lentzea xinjiangensis]|uniref:Uncharacterized protein n=1 Tax=Lentzea xinjiangensis TaxID=402600 RepID=A0A1H9TEJ2_9PSEU|nr:hypothetical protein [Lentzea xinjiangensis]SER95740.1 hypothetical protein SAMN05216188_11881 [Lentzea xinjiangensis]